MNEINRNYSMPDADLMMFASNLALRMTRDSAEFEDYAVDSAAIVAFTIRCFLTNLKDVPFKQRSCDLFVETKVL